MNIYSVQIIWIFLNIELFAHLCSLKAFSHWAHLCGFSPVWVSRCFFRSLARLNDLLHCSHLCGSSPVWVSICLASWLGFKNVLTHMLQGILLAMFIISLKISSDWAVETVFVVKDLDCAPQLVDNNWENEDTQNSHLPTFPFSDLTWLDVLCYRLHDVSLCKILRLTCCFEVYCYPTQHPA